MMRRIKSALSTWLPSFFVAALLGGCTLAGPVGRDIIQYQNAGGNSANAQLLVNIVRARDEEPLHFSQLTQLHGAGTLSGSFSALIPIGINSGNLTQNIGGTAMFSESPSFDIGTLDDQKFWKSIITQPISADVIDQLIRNDGLDQRMAYLLFFSEFDQIRTDPRDDSVYLNDDLPSESQSANSNEKQNWSSYMDWVDKRVQEGLLFAHTYKELIPVGPILSSRMQLKDLEDIDSSKFTLRPAENGYQLYSTSEKTLFCIAKNSKHITDGERYEAIAWPLASVPEYYYGPKENELCSLPEVVAGARANPGLFSTLHVRSVYGILQYLGMVLRYQAGKTQKQHNQCITLTNPESKGRGLCNQDPLFKLTPDDPDPLVYTKYNNNTLVISKFNPSCTAASDAIDVPPSILKCDYSAQTLATVTLLLNLNKDLQDVPTTPTVRNVPVGGGG